MYRLLGWCYRWLLRPVIYLVTWKDPELATDWALTVLEWIERHPSCLRLLRKIGKKDDSRLQQTLWGIDFRGLVGLAAGWTKNGRALAALSCLFDFIVVGSVLPDPQWGNPRQRIWRLLARVFGKWMWLIANRMGFPSEGVTEVAKRLRHYADSFGSALVPIGISIGSNKETGPENAHEDYITVYRYLRSTVDDAIAFFEVNISSPNTEWLRKLGQVNYFEYFLTKVINGFREGDAETGRQPKLVVIKVSPDMERNEYENLVIVCRGLGVEVLAGTNTTVNRDGLTGKAAALPGGISGSFLHPLAVRTLANLNTVACDIEIIAGGGVEDFKTAWAMEEVANVRLLFVLSAFFNRSPFIAREINESYARAMDKRGVSSLSELRSRR